jgi:uncharacterized protein YndB with AHSA1/START domain/ketosteroid isomerase-like protein
MTTTPRMTKGRIDSAARLIRADAAVVYRAYVDPSALVRWLPPRGMRGRIEAFDARTGGGYRIVLTYDNPGGGGVGKTTNDTDVVHGRFLELVPNRRIVQSVLFESPDPRFAGEMRMTWRLEPATHGTTVVIIAENVPEGVAPADHVTGFTATLENLASFVEGSDGTTNVRAIHRFFELMKSKDIDGWARLWADDGAIWVCYPPAGFPDSIKGRDQIVAGFRQLFRHFGTYDYRIKSTYQTTDPDVVIVEWNVSATLPGRGTTYRGNNITVFRFRHGLIADYHDYFDPRKFQIVVDALSE